VWQNLVCKSPEIYKNNKNVSKHFLNVCRVTHVRVRVAKSQQNINKFFKSAVGGRYSWRGNMRCGYGSGSCILNLNCPAFIVPETEALIRTDGRSDRHGTTIDSDQEYI